MMRLMKRHTGKRQMQGEQLWKDRSLPQIKVDEWMCYFQVDLVK